MGHRSAASNDAERKAQDLARQKGTCYERVRPEQCKQDGSEWVSVRTKSEGLPRDLFAGRAASSSAAAAVAWTWILEA